MKYVALFTILLSMLANPLMARQTIDEDDQQDSSSRRYVLSPTVTVEINHVQIIIRLILPATEVTHGPSAPSHDDIVQSNAPRLDYSAALHKSVESEVDDTSFLCGLDPLFPQCLYRGDDSVEEEFINLVAQTEPPAQQSMDAMDNSDESLVMMFQSGVNEFAGNVYNDVSSFVFGVNACFTPDVEKEKTE